MIFLKVAYKNLVILEISPHDIIAVGICNMRGTTVMWDKETGSILHNAIGGYFLSYYKLEISYHRFLFIS